jgi:hypothetical protein
MWGFVTKADRGERDNICTMTVHRDKIHSNMQIYVYIFNGLHTSSSTQKRNLLQKSGMDSNPSKLLPK